jgi:transcriptional regulator with XRE-family HTH domain
LPADRSSAARTRIAAKRLERGVSQRALARAVGLTRTTYWRLEHGRTDNPPFRYLVNIAIALDCPVHELLEEHWMRWKSFNVHAAHAPRREELWSAPFTEPPIWSSRARTGR